MRKAITIELNFNKEDSNAGLYTESFRDSKVTNSAGGIVGFMHSGGAASMS